MTDQVLRQQQNGDSEQTRRPVAFVALRRIADPQDVARAIAIPVDGRSGR